MLLRCIVNTITQMFLFQVIQRNICFQWNISQLSLFGIWKYQDEFPNYVKIFFIRKWTDRPRKKLKNIVLIEISMWTFFSIFLMKLCAFTVINLHVTSFKTHSATRTFEYSLVNNTQYVKINDQRSDIIVTFTQIKVKVEKRNRPKFKHESVFDRSIVETSRRQKPMVFSVLQFLCDCHSDR